MPTGRATASKVVAGIDLPPSGSHAGSAEVIVR